MVNVRRLNDLRRVLSLRCSVWFISPLGIQVSGDKDNGDVNITHGQSDFLYGTGHHEYFK